MIDIPDSILPKNSEGKAICPKCMQIVEACECPSFDPNKPKTDLFTPDVGLDKSGRNGKIVTLIRGLPGNEEYLEELSRTLKVRTGSGGTYYITEGFGIIELQGNQLKMVEKVLRDENYNRRKIKGK